MYSVHCMQLGVQCTQLCTVYTCTPADGVQGNIWTFVSSIFLHFLHISHLWREGCRERPPFCTGLVTYFASLRPSSPSQHHFHFQEVLKRFTKSRRKSSVRRRNLESDTFRIGHFTTGTRIRLLVICLCCLCCCLCFQMAFRSSRKLVHNVQVFQVELPPKLWPHPRQSSSRSIYPTLPIRGTCCNLERI